MPTKKATTVPKPPAKDAPSVTMCLKGALQYRRWVNDLAAHCRTTVADIMDLALVNYARQAGFPGQAPMRNVRRRGPSPRGVDRETRGGDADQVTATIILGFKTTPEHRRWVNDLAAHCRTTAVNVMDLALVSHARQAGFPEPAPRRNAAK